MNGAISKISAEDRVRIINACITLNSPGFAIQLADRIGMPVDYLLHKLPENWQTILQENLHRCLFTCMQLGTLRMCPEQRTAGEFRYRIANSLLGTAGAIGWKGCLVELPLSTAGILRATAAEARAAGEDIRQPETLTACLEVFAFGGSSPDDDEAETGYFAVRAALARSVDEAAQYLASRSTIHEGAPVLVRLINEVGQRFGLRLTQKAAAASVPLLGAIGGASINYAFTSHYQKMAKAHFFIRSMEKKYGEEPVRALSA